AHAGLGRNRLYPTAGRGGIHGTVPVVPPPPAYCGKPGSNSQNRGVTVRGVHNLPHPCGKSATPAIGANTKNSTESGRAPARSPLVLNCSRLVKSQIDQPKR